MKSKIACAAKNELFRRLQFLPVVIFVLYARFKGMDTLAWREAFIIGGAFALLEFMFFAYKKWIPNPFISGVNLFLIVGGYGFISNNLFILYAYKHMQQSALFACMLFMGLLATLISKKGYIQSAQLSKKKVRQGSAALLLVNCFAIALSYHFRGNFLYAGTLPLIILIISQKMIVRVLLLYFASQHYLQPKQQTVSVLDDCVVIYKIA